MAYSKKMMLDWVAALESGEYKQTEGTLKRDLEDGTFGYCCLGVLCEINNVEVGPVDPESEYEGSKENYNWTLTKMPQRLNRNGIDFNDEGKSFTEISKMIKNYMQEIPEEFE